VGHSNGVTVGRGVLCVVRTNRGVIQQWKEVVFSVWSMQRMYDEQSAVSQKNRRFAWDSCWPAGMWPWE
jgi:hypothetical protein